MAGLFDGAPPPLPTLPSGMDDTPSDESTPPQTVGSDDQETRPQITGRLASILGSADDSSDGQFSAYKLSEGQPLPPQPEVPSASTQFPAASRPQAPTDKQSISELGLQFIRDQEESGQYKKDIYTDPARYKTIGYGHMLRPGEAELFRNGIDQDIAEQLLNLDAADAEAVIHKHVTVPLTQQQHDALVSFVFAFGGEKFAQSTVLRELNAGRPQQAADALRLWNKERKNGQLVPSRGLTDRREKERNLFLNGRYW